MSFVLNPGAIGDPNQTPIVAVPEFKDHRASCACGDHTVPEGFGCVPDPVDDRFLHSPALCFLLDDEADEVTA